MKKLILTILSTFFLSICFAQFTQNPRKLLLNQQTGSKGLTHYSSGKPDYTPSTRFDAYTYQDTTNQVLYYFYASAWYASSMLKQVLAPLAQETVSSQVIINSKVPWFNTVDSNYYYYSHNASAWQPFDGIYYGNTAPVNIGPTAANDSINYTSSLWHNVSNDSIYFYQNGWLPVGHGILQQELIDSTLAIRESLTEIQNLIGVQEPDDTIKTVIYKPAHGFTLAAGDILALKKGFDPADATISENLQITYATGLPHPDSVEIQTSGLLFRPGHPYKIGLIYYVTNTPGVYDTIPGTIQSPAFFVVDNDYLDLMEQGPNFVHTIPRIVVSTALINSLGGDPFAPHDTIMQEVAEIYQNAGRAPPGTVFVTNFPASSDNPTYHIGSGTIRPSTPSNLWFWDGQQVTRGKELIVSVDLDATNYGGLGTLPLDTVELVGGVPVDTTVANWYQTNHTTNGLNLPNGSLLYWIGDGSRQNPDYVWMLSDDLSSTASAESQFRKIVRRVKSPDVQQVFSSGGTGAIQTADGSGNFSADNSFTISGGLFQVTGGINHRVKMVEDAMILERYDVSPGAGNEFAIRRANTNTSNPSTPLEGWTIGGYVWQAWSDITDSWQGYGGIVPLIGDSLNHKSDVQIQVGALDNGMVVKANKDLEIPGYPNTRDDSGTDTPLNFLYTDVNGGQKSAPITVLGGGDNLGNHEMTQNLETGANWIARDGSFKGLFLENYGGAIFKALATSGGHMGLDVQFNALSSYTNTAAIRLNALNTGNAPIVYAETSLNKAEHGWDNNGDKLYWKHFTASTTNNIMEIQGDGDVEFDDPSDGSSNLMIKNDGNIGLNEGDPDTLLEVNGDCKVKGVIYLNDAKTLGIFTGSGSPESSISADIGSTYHRTDGGAGTSFYVKESGTGNTGWVAK